MARELHLVLSITPDRDEPTYKIHGAWLNRKNAEAYQETMNLDLVDGEAQAQLDSVAVSKLTAKFLQGKLCFKVEMSQLSMTQMSIRAATTTAPINTEATYSRHFAEEGDQHHPEGTPVFLWTGWADNRPDAIKRAQLAAMSSWVCP